MDIIYLAPLISAMFIFILWGLGRHKNQIKLLWIFALVSFVVIFGSMGLQWLGIVDFAGGHWGNLLGFVVWGPGITILSPIASLCGVSGWSMIHGDWWIVSICVSSFIFYTIVLFGVIKIIAYTRMKVSQRKALPSV